MKAKKNSGCGTLILLLIAIGIAITILQTIYTTLKARLGDAALIVVIILLYTLFLAFSIKGLRANRYMKKHWYDVVFCNNEMNKATSLKDYFDNRDRLIAYLEKMEKTQILLNKTNKSMWYVKHENIKPSDLLRQLSENENLSLHSAILRSAEHCKIAMKSYGATSALFEMDIQNQWNRLSPEHQKEATDQLALVKSFEKIVGTIEEVDQLDGHAFEHWCADLLSKLGFFDVEVTKGSGDQGVDVLASKEGLRYAVQCKCYSHDLGNTPVQEVHAGKNMYHCQVGAVMTNRYFTAGAKELAHATGVLLWDRDWIINKLEQ